MAATPKGHRGHNSNGYRTTRVRPLLACLTCVFVATASVPSSNLSAQVLESFLPAAPEVSPDAVVVTEEVRDSVAARVYTLADGSLNLAVRLFPDRSSAQQFVVDFTDAPAMADGFARGITNASGLEPDSVTFSKSDPQLGDSSGTILVRIFMAAEGFAIAALTFSTDAYAVHMQLAAPIGRDPTARAKALALTVLEKLRPGDA